MTDSRFLHFVVGPLNEAQRLIKRAVDVVVSESVELRQKTGILLQRAVERVSRAVAAGGRRDDRAVGQTADVEDGECRRGRTGRRAAVGDDALGTAAGPGRRGSPGVVECVGLLVERRAPVMATMLLPSSVLQSSLVKLLDLARSSVEVNVPRVATS